MGEGTHRWWGAEWVKLSGAVGVRPNIVRVSENSLRGIPPGQMLEKRNLNIAPEYLSNDNDQN